MTTTTIRPNSTTVGLNVGSILGGAASLHAALSDSSDSTAVRCGSAAPQGGAFEVGFGTFTLPAGAVVIRTTNFFRASSLYPTPPTAQANVFRTVGGGGGLPGPLQPITWSGVQTVSNSATLDQFGNPLSSQADIDGYQLRIESISTMIDYFDAWVEIQYALVPTVAITAPPATVGTTSPTVAWTHTPGADAQTGQTRYRVAVFRSTDLVNPVYDSGDVASNAASAVVGPLPLGGANTFQVWVTTAQTSAGVVQYSNTTTANFTVNVTPSTITSVVATPTDSTGTIAGVVTWNNTSPTWETIDVQASYDGGTTWVPVRGYTTKAVSGATATFVDYEAPNNVAVQYRARANRTVSGSLITGNWTNSNVTQWTNTSNDTWVKDPANPARNMKVCISSLPESTYSRTVGVFRPIGARFPVTVSDVLPAPTSTVQVLTRTQAEETAFLSLLTAPVLLVQSPNQPWSFGSRYVATGNIIEGRTSPTSKTANRLFNIDLTEVDRPA